MTVRSLAGAYSVGWISCRSSTWTASCHACSSSTPSMTGGVGVRDDAHGFLARAVGERFLRGASPAVSRARQERSMCVAREPQSNRSGRARMIAIRRRCREPPLSNLQVFGGSKRVAGRRRSRNCAKIDAIRAWVGDRDGTQLLAATLHVGRAGAQHRRRRAPLGGRPVRSGQAHDDHGHHQQGRLDQSARLHPHGCRGREGRRSRRGASSRCRRPCCARPASRAR